MTIHWSADDKDATKTGCDVLVGYILAETEDEVTRVAANVDCQECRGFLYDADVDIEVKVHWAPNLVDGTKSGCGENVSVIAVDAMLNNDETISLDPKKATCKECREFLDAAEEHANTKVYGEG